MIQMRHREGRWKPVPRRRIARPLVTALTLAAIAAASLAMRPTADSGAVMRVSLDRVPEERVVEFGHEMPRLAMVSPVPPTANPVDPIPVAGNTVTGTGMSQKLASVPERQTRPQAAVFVAPDSNGILPIDFELQEGVSSQVGGVGVAKTLAAEDGQATGLTIFLIGGSLIEVDRQELIAALAQLGASDKAGRVPPAGETGRLSLDRVRTAGLDLRYDAIRDRLILRP